MDFKDMMRSSMSTGLKYAFGFQLASKATTFLLNTIIFREMLPEERGIVFALDLFVISVLTLSRTSWRNSVMRVDFAKKEISIIKSGIYFIPFAVLLLVLGAFSFYFFLSEEVRYCDFFFISFILYIIGTFLEILSEPYYLIANTLNLYDVKAKIEGIGLLLKVISCVVISFLLNKKMFIIPFGLSQIMFGGTILFCYMRYFKSFKFRFRKIDLLQWEKDDTTHAWLILSFFRHSIVKFFLTEGEKYIIMMFENLPSLGIYDLVSRLCSLVVRIFFKPIEDIAFNTWSQLLSEEVSEMGPIAKSKSKEIFIFFMKLLILVGYFIIFYSPAYSSTMIFVLYGMEWSSTDSSKVLILYSCYVFTLAVNGVSEAFVRASSNQIQMKRNLLWIIFVSVVYILCSILFIYLNMGIYGIIAANIINMSLRIIFSFYYIIDFFKDQFLILKLINFKLFVIFFFVLLVTKTSEFFLIKEEIKWAGVIIHGCVGCFCLVLTLLGIFKYDREFTLNAFNVLLNRNRSGHFGDF